MLTGWNADSKREHESNQTKSATKKGDSNEV